MQSKGVNPMSSQAIASPDELEHFARELKQFTTQLRDSTSRINGQFAHLSNTWRDQEQAKFAREFEQTMRVLQQFMRSADQQIPVLHRKAQHLREYMK
jgi:uncharacterized protein YukE